MQLLRQEYNTAIWGRVASKSTYCQKLFIDEFRWAKETSPMPEQELPINAGISLEPAANPDVHSIGETKQEKFMSEADARAQGYRPAKNGQ